jgi:hypothetical protein
VVRGRSDGNALAQEPPPWFHHATDQAPKKREGETGLESGFPFSSCGSRRGCQNVSFKDPCRVRGELANRIFPKFELLIEVFGGAKRVWLRTLNASTRIANCTG